MCIKNSISSTDIYGTEKPFESIISWRRCGSLVLIVEKCSREEMSTTGTKEWIQPRNVTYYSIKSNFSYFRGLNTYSPLFLPVIDIVGRENLAISPSTGRSQVTRGNG